MKVATYFHDVSDPGCPKELLNRWATSFALHGFEPIILTEKDALKHPRQYEIIRLISDLPTVNDRKYERACWLRWLAYASVAPAFFTDIDVINFTFKPSDVCTRFPMTAHTTEAGPAAVYATPIGLEYFTEQIKNAKYWLQEVQGKPHVSDMLIYQRCFVGQFTSHCWDCCYPYAMQAPLVHFGNACVKEEWRGKNRYLAVDDFVERRKEYELRTTVAS